MQQVGVLGSGAVAKVLAQGFTAHGYTVKIGSRSADKVAAFAAEADIGAGTFHEVAAWADTVVLAVKGSAALATVQDLAAALAGKTVLDATNPIADLPPEDGVLRFFTGPNESLMEQLQAAAPTARFVKAFSCVGNALMVNPVLKGDAKSAMFICGNDEAAKAAVRRLCEQFGHDVWDLGTAKAARGIEPLCIVWCLPGFRQNDWTHAFAMLRA
jgi:predicted dinucleotide-binding enzyme